MIATVENTSQLQNRQQQCATIAFKVDIKIRNENRIAKAVEKVNGAMLLTEPWQSPRAQSATQECIHPQQVLLRKQSAMVARLAKRQVKRATQKHPIVSSVFRTRTPMLLTPLHASRVETLVLQKQVRRFAVHVMLGSTC